MKTQRKMLRESDDLKQRIADAIKKMRTAIKNGKSVEITDEIKKRGRTDKATGKSTKDYEKIKKEGLKRALRKKIMEMKRKKMQEAVDRDELQKRLMAKYGLTENDTIEEDFEYTTDKDYFVGDYSFKVKSFDGDEKNMQFPASQTIRNDKGDIKFSEAEYNAKNHTITFSDLYISDFDGDKKEAKKLADEIISDIWEDKGVKMFKKSKTLKENDVITEDEENPENDEMDFEDDVETEEDTNNTEESEEKSDDETTEEEPVEDEGESEESDEDSEDEENPEDEDAIFDVEDDAEELNTDDDSDDIDSIIASLLQAESKKAKKDDKKEEKKPAKKSAKKDEEEIEEKCGSKKKAKKEDKEDETIKEENEGDDVDNKIDSDIEDAQNESDQVQESIERLIKSFGKKYPDVFNESIMNKLTTLFEMYANAKAKVKTAKKSKKIIENVNAYMESVKKGLRAEAEKKYSDVISENAKLKKVLKRTVYKRKIEESKESDSVSKKNRMLMNVIRKLRKENREIVAESENVKGIAMKLKKTLKEMKVAEDRKKMRSIMKENKMAEKADMKKVQKVVRKPVRRSDKTLTAESIKRAISNRTQTRLTDDEIDEMRNHNTNTINESEEVDMTQFEKHIW